MARFRRSRLVRRRVSAKTMDRIWWGKHLDSRGVSDSRLRWRVCLGLELR
jgi:hypothetical protein